MLLFIRKNVGWSLLALCIAFMTAVTLASSIGVFAGRNGAPLALAASLYYPLLVVHIFLGTVAVFLGICQFLPQIRVKRPRVHRIIGRTYMGSVLTSGVIALFVALFTVDFNEQIAFIALDVLWLFSGYKAFSAIRRKKVEEHRRWIVRNYAMTLAAIFARLVVPLLIVVLLLRGSSSASGFQELLTKSLGTGVWLSIVFNLTIADWLVNRRWQAKAFSEYSAD